MPEDTKIETIRLLADGDYVVAHSEFVSSGSKVAFDIFRFENGKIVEHWDNIQDKCPAPNKSGRTQLDGPTEVTDVDRM
jgi:predicted SnoaL-like aldol condensation-catalyzing enzyme